MLLSENLLFFSAIFSHLPPPEIGITRYKEDTTCQLGLQLFQVRITGIHPVAITHRSLVGFWKQGLASAMVSHLQVKLQWKADFLQPLVTGSSSGWGLHRQAAVAILRKAVFLQLMVLSAHAGLCSCSRWSPTAACNFLSALGLTPVCCWAWGAAAQIQMFTSHSSRNVTGFYHHFYIF